MSGYEWLDLAGTYILPLMGVLIAFVFRSAKKEFTSKIDLLQTEMVSLRNAADEKMGALQSNTDEKTHGVRELVNHHVDDLNSKLSAVDEDIRKHERCFQEYRLNTERFKTEVEAYKLQAVQTFADKQHYAHRTEALTEKMDGLTEKLLKLYSEITENLMQLNQQQRQQ